MHASDPPGAHPAPFPLDARCDAALRDCMSTDEARRLAALRSLKILNTLPEAAYDRIVRRVNECLGVPVCVISLAEQDEMWFKAKVGTALDSLPRDGSFCQAALESADLLVVPDALASPVFRAHPLVIGEPHIRFYAGVPLVLENGHRVGVLCMMDFVPRTLDARQRDALKDFAAMVVDELHLRMKTLMLEAQLKRQHDAEALAIAREKARADFLAMVTHEVRAPLNAIAGMVSLACEGATGSHEAFNAQTLRDMSEHLVRLINEVLDLAKLEATGFTLRHEAFDLRRELRCALAAVRPQLEAKGVVLESDIAPAVPAAVYGDRTRVAQVVMNLLGNAVKFTAQGRVELKVDAQPARAGTVNVEIRVSDTGIGIASDALRGLFSRFMQAAPDVRARYGGSGLGLAICHRLVTAMHGTIDVRSVPGAGTTFVCTIPFDVATQAQARAEPAGDAPDRGDTLVLVADDDDVSRKVCKALIARLGYRVEAFASGRDALAALRTRPFDVAVLDIHMPDLDGFTLARELRTQTQFGAPVPLLALTGASLPAGDARLALFDDYLIKPVSSRMLDAAIVRVLSMRDGSDVPHAAEVPE